MGTESSFGRRADFMITIVELYTRDASWQVANLLLEVRSGTPQCRGRRVSHSVRVGGDAAEQGGGRAPQCKRGGTRQCRVYAQVRGVRPNTLHWSKRAGPS